MRNAVDVAESGIVATLTEAALRSMHCESAAEAWDRIGEVLTIAEEWAAGRLPIWELGKLTTPQERFAAVRFTKPEPTSLRDAIDALIDATPDPDHGHVYRTKHGCLTEAEIVAAGGSWRMVDGRVVITFPDRRERVETTGPRWLTNGARP